METFLIKKSVTEMIIDLASLKPGENERFATFEIRIRNMLNQVLDAGISKDEMVS